MSRSRNEARDQEVVRANRELAAYFKGGRTEREARAALKIIKAFIRERERGDPAHLRPLPRATNTASAGQRKTRRAAHRKTSRKSRAPVRQKPAGPQNPPDGSDKPNE
jgi:hypothetical protein